MVRLTGEACRAARALLGWSVRDLTSKARVAPNTLSELEGKDREGKPKSGEIPAEAAARILTAFDDAGVEILNGDAPGARFKPGSRP